MINLCTHTIYSYEQSLLKIEELVEFSKKNGYESFCVTDIGSVTAFVKSFKIAKNESLKFIPGYQIKIKPDFYVFKDDVNARLSYLKNQMTLKKVTEESKARYQEEIDFLFGRLKNESLVDYHLLSLIAKNQNGLENIFKIYNDEKEINGHWLGTNERIMELGDDCGLYVLSGGDESEIMYYLKTGEYDKAEYIIEHYHNKFGEDFIIQINYNPTLKEQYLNLMKMSVKHNIMAIPTSDVRYSKKIDEDNYHYYRNILNFPESQITSNGHLFTKDELLEAFLNLYKDDLDDGMIKKMFDNLDIIEQSCEETSLPRANSLQDCSEELEKLCIEGWNKLRKGTKFEKESWERFHYELEIINQRNFSQYFIKVLNIVQTAYDLGILVGPSRGSGGGSEICYLIGITKLDPLKYDLYFERFMNPGRISGFPDIDLDISATVNEEDLRSILERKKLIVLPMGKFKPTDTIDTISHGKITAQQVYDLLQQDVEIEV